MKLFHTDLFVLPLPDSHRFPMARYRLLRERLQASGLFNDDEIQIPPAATDQQLAHVHTADWITRVAAGQLTDDELRRIGFPWSLQMVERSRRSTGATIAASRYAMTEGVAANLAGGTHHAFADRGAGYCVFNDVAVAARTLQQERLIQKVMIVDGDVHQGDGTAKIFQHDASVRTFSLHAAKAFPARKQVGDVDIALPPGTTDEDYLAQWCRGLDMISQDFQPDLVYYLAGADPYEGDTLGGLGVTKRGLMQRDQMLFELCRFNRWPLVITLAGGYAKQIQDIVEIQFATIVLAKKFLNDPSININILSWGSNALTGHGSGSDWPRAARDPG